MADEKDKKFREYFEKEIVSGDNLGKLVLEYKSLEEQLKKFPNKTEELKKQIEEKGKQFTDAYSVYKSLVSDEKVDPKNAAHYIKNFIEDKAVLRFVAETATRIGNALSLEDRIAQGTKALEHDFKENGIDLSKKYEGKSLIENFSFGQLSKEDQETVKKYLSSSLKEQIAKVMMNAQYTKETNPNKTDEDLSKEMKKELEKYVGVFVEKIYGFSKELTSSIAESLLSQRGAEGEAASIIKGLIERATKKVYSTMDTSSKNEIAKNVYNSRIKPYAQMAAATA